MHELVPVHVPPLLPCLSLSTVLLPTGFARLTLPAHRRGNVELLEHLCNQAHADVLVVVLPDLTSGGSTSSKDDMRPELIGSMIGSIGTCARVLQLARMLQTGESVILLEGVCRVRIDGIAPGVNGIRNWTDSAAMEGEASYDQVHVTQLELGVDERMAPPPGSSLQVTGSTDVERAEQSVAELGAKLQSGVRALLKQLTRTAGAGGSLPTQRFQDQLASVPAWRAADIVASALAPGPQERLQVLQAVEQRPRIRLATSLTRTALQSLRKGAPVGAAASPGASAWGARGLLGPGRRIPAAAGGGEAGQGPSVGDEADDVDEVDALLARLVRAKPPAEVMRVATKEANRLRQSGESQPGHAAARAYLEVLADLPWSRTSADAALEATTAGGDSGDPVHIIATTPPLSLTAARNLLDAQHYGLEKIKSRVVEFLAVLRLRGTTARAPILLLTGPPGMGKTSLARSIAEALGRPFVRVSLGGVRDEAEVRGHRRTYVGSMPGRIIQALRRARVCDPVILLDELDKLGHDAVRGDPSAALLEVLDPEQNAAFTDTYLGLPVDLSRATFICTANRTSEIPGPLLDRLEVLTLSGYTTEEKRHIASQHLVPQALAAHGLSASHIVLPEPLLELIITRWTREAGVRSLARQLAALCRHVAVSIVTAHEEGGTSRILALLPEPTPPLSCSGGSTDCSHLPVSGGAMRAAQLQPQQCPKRVQPPAPRPQGLQRLRASVARLSSRQPTRQSQTSPLHLQQPEYAQSVFSSIGAAITSHADAAGRQRARMSVSKPKAGPLATLSEISRATQAAHVQAVPHLSALQHGIGGHHHQTIYLTEELVEAILGPPRYSSGAEVGEAVALPGCATGLVWTSMGGSVQYIECLRLSVGQPGRTGTLTMTGQVGEVLEESARIAFTWLVAHAAQLGLVGLGLGHDFQLPAEVLHASASVATAPADLWHAPGLTAAAAAEATSSSCLDLVPSSSSGGTRKSSSGHVATPALTWDIHIHLPSGGVPKDGPSAGVTIAVALLSLLSGRTARSDTAMTGELTLRGLVLPIGGVKEKLLAARQAGVQRVIVPSRNMPDVLADVPLAIRNALTIIPVSRLEQVFAAAFDPPYVMDPPTLLPARL